MSILLRVKFIKNQSILKQKGFQMSKILNQEVLFEDVNPHQRPVISKTDPKGIITYTNSIFRALSGYSKGEMIGRPHNIVRHPDMPKVIFKNMWETLKQGKSWNGFIKNLRKDGKYYWVEAFINPIIDEDTKEILGYVSARVKVPDDIKEYYEKFYKELRLKEQNAEKVEFNGTVLYKKN